MVRYPRPEYIAQILQDLGSQDSEVRRVAALKLADAGDPSVTDALAMRLKNDESPDVRAAAALSVGRLGGEGARTALLQCLQQDPDEKVRAACITGLSALLKRGQPMERAFLEALHSDSDAERSAAAYALGQTGRRSHARSLIPLLSDGSWLVRLATSAALVELQMAYEEVISALEELAASAPDSDSARLAGHVLECARRMKG